MLNCCNIHPPLFKPSLSAFTMLKKAGPYIAASGLLIIALVFFNIGYRALINYSELTNKHFAVLNTFQDLSKQIYNAAILNPDSGRSFYTDSLIIFKQLNFLTTTGQDSVNHQIAGQLDTLIRSNISWLIKSNVPDSVIHKKTLAHVAAFESINSLIDHGIDRTLFLIEHRKTQLNIEIRDIRLLIVAFIVSSGLLLLYTTIRAFMLKGIAKKKEIELEIVLNRIKDGVVSVDNNWRYTFLNNAAMATHPLGRDKTLGKVIWDIHPGMIGTILWDKYHEAMETRTVVEVETYYAPMDTWFSVSVYPSDDGVTIFYKNVTEAKKFQEQHALFASIVNSSDDAILSKTLNGTITSWNAGAGKIFGYTSEEMIGRNISILIPSKLRNEENRIIEKIRSGETIDHYETERVRKDREIITVSLTISPIRDASGKVIGASKICRDITQRKQAEEMIRKSEKTYRTIASSIPGSVICLLDPDYRYFLIEGDMLEKLGYSKRSLLGKKASDALPPEIFNTVREEFKRVFEGESITRESNRLGYDIVSRLIPLRDENNIVYAIMTVSINVTELKNAQRNVVRLNRGLEEKIKSRTEQLIKSNEDLEAFSYSVSHDLRAPLRGISGFAAILEDEYGGKLDQEANRIIKIIKGNTIKMGQLIDDLLAFSRMGKQDIRKTMVNTQMMIGEILNDLIEQNTNQPSITWQIGELPEINADVNAIRQVWVNFLSNAVKYSKNRKQPCITIDVAVQEEYNIFSIKDNGVGFDEQYSNKLFKVFQRLHDSEEFEGTGVGLAIVEKIVSKHGGKVWAEGKPDEGACFYFSLPI